MMQVNLHKTGAMQVNLHKTGAMQDKLQEILHGKGYRYTLQRITAQSIQILNKVYQY